ncbi:MAG: guanylate kinase [Gammaproteobacteria bacterium]
MNPGTAGFFYVTPDVCKQSAKSYHRGTFKKIQLMGSGDKLKRGQLFILSAPSGAGKTTLVRKLMAADTELAFSISYTTREARKGEVDGEHYYFVALPLFKQMIDRGEFLEHAQVFDNYYGTSKAQVESILDSGKNVILEIDWQGAQQVRANMPDCRSIFIMPPSITELQKRLHGRSTDSEEVIARRLADALGDMSHWREFDFVVINDDLDNATGQLQSIIRGQNQENATSGGVAAVLAEQILA